MSLISRLVASASCLLGAGLIGYVQGIRTIDDAAANIVAISASADPKVGLYFGTYLVGLLQASVNVNYGISWVTGVLLLIGGFVLLALSDRKRDSPPAQTS